MAECNRVAMVPAIVYLPSMPLARAHALSAHGPIYALTVIGLVRGTPSLCHTGYSLETTVDASQDDYERMVTLRQSLAHHKLEVMGFLGEVSIRLVPSARGLRLCADARAWSDLLRRRAAVRVEWYALSEIEAAVRLWLNNLN
ncbi:hypothetical protein LZC95_20230 [Pendulispora brunnea]|uniref:Uncharacterized protein n=1 Tax=Pendulispora brunnea TaxID=2905690 RepID=A0ABZ2KKD8_9BACT